VYLHCKWFYETASGMLHVPQILQFTSYFMELATPHTEEAIKFIDKVGGFEWLIQKYEMDGASAIKLDLSLDTPIIIVPKNSKSEEYVNISVIV
jgi:vacuolar protein sorting-associated protein 13A/C